MKLHVTRYQVDTCTFKKIQKNKNKNNKIQKNHKITCGSSETWQSLFIVINDLNGVSKKRPN